MNDLPLDLSHNEKPTQIQENLIAYMRLFAGLNGIVVEDTDTFWIVSHKGAPGNNILKVRWPEGGVEERIDGLFARVGQHIDAIDWLLFPGDQPAGLGKRLKARGMPGGLAGNWLWADLAALAPAPAAPPEFHIEQVRDDHGMAEWTRASEAGFGGQPGDLEDFYAAYARHGYGPEAFSLHYTGYWNDTPAITGTLLDAGGSASIYDVSTLPDYRRKGLGGVLTCALMREIRARGYSDTWIWSSNMARGLYRSLGYVDADFGIREHKWKK